MSNKLQFIRACLEWARIHNPNPGYIAWAENRVAELEREVAK
jgi:hypothetical protein